MVDHSLDLSALSAFAYLAFANAYTLFSFIYYNSYSLFGALSFFIAATLGLFFFGASGVFGLAAIIEARYSSAFYISPSFNCNTSCDNECDIVSIVFIVYIIQMSNMEKVIG